MTTIVLPVLLTLCLGGVFVAAVDNEAVYCIDGRLTLHADIGKCLYYSNTERGSWYGSSYICRKYFHTQLFYPGNDLEFDTTRQLLIDNGDSEAWLGACKLDNGDFVTSDGQNYTGIWDGSYGLTDSGNPTGYLQVQDDEPAFSYTHRFWKYRHYICGKDACRIDCDRLDALIEAFEDLL